MDVFDLTALDREGSLENWLRALAEACCKQFRATSCTLFLKQGEEFRLIAATGLRSGLPADTSILPGRGVAGKAIADRQASLVNDPSVYGAEGHGKSKSALVVPLLGTREVVGVLNISRDKGARFSEWHLTRARILAAQVGLAVQNAWYADEIRKSAHHRHLALLGEVAASVAHDVRNPLTSIIAAAQTIREEPELADEMTQIIEREARVLDTLCDDFLNLSKPLTLALEVVDPYALAKEVCESAALECRSHGVGLQVEGESLWLRADALRFRQLVRNLVRNAMQATASGGTISVRVLKTGLEVADNGKGMDEQTIGRLFDAFYSTKQQGTGLGLSNVRRIVEEHGWSISVESAPNVGTSFKIDFKVWANAA